MPARTRQPSKKAMIEKALIHRNIAQLLPQKPKTVLSAARPLLKGERGKTVADTLETLALTKRGFFKNPVGTTLVGAKFAGGDKAFLKELASERLIVPVAKSGEHWRRASAGRTKEFMIPARRPDVTPLFGHVHGRSVFAERGKTFFFKGVGKPDYEVHRRGVVHGGEIMSVAQYNVDMQRKLLAAYKRLAHKNSQGFRLAASNGATFFPGMQSPVLFKLAQLPVETRFYRPWAKKEKKAAKIAPMIKTVSKAAAYSLPRGAASNMAVLGYHVRTPFRLVNLQDVSLGRLLPLYSLHMKGGLIYSGSRQISREEAATLVAKAFAARQGMAYLVAKEAKVLASSSMIGGYSVFSRHNTTIAGENVDYDTVSISKRGGKEAKKLWANDERQILKNIAEFSRNICGKLTVPERAKELSAASSDLFKEIIGS